MLTSLIVVAMMHCPPQGCPAPTSFPRPMPTMRNFVEKTVTTTTRVSTTAVSMLFERRPVRTILRTTFVGVRKVAAVPVKIVAAPWRR